MVIKIPIVLVKQILMLTSIVSSNQLLRNPVDVGENINTNKTFLNLFEVNSS